MIGAGLEAKPLIEGLRSWVRAVGLDGDHGCPPAPNRIIGSSEDFDELRGKASASEFRLHIKFVNRANLTAEFVGPEGNQQSVAAKLTFQLARHASPSDADVAQGRKERGSHAARGKTCRSASLFAIRWETSWNPYF